MSPSSFRERMVNPLIEACIAYLEKERMQVYVIMNICYEWERRLDGITRS